MTQVPSPPQRGTAPIFGPYLLWPNGSMYQDATWYEGRARTRQSPQFSAHVYCGQTAAWIKMPLCMKVGLGSGHIVLDGDPAPPPQIRGHNAQFSAHICCGHTAEWIKMPLGIYDGRPRPGQHCVRCGPSSIPKGHILPKAPSNFRPMSDCGQTVAHLNYC